MAYDLGDVVHHQVNITDSAGVAANAGAVTCTITLPDNSTTSPTVTNSTTGTYTIDYTPTQVGRHTERWVATGANSSAYTDVFDVRAAQSTNLLSLEDARAALNLTATTNDEELRSYIEAVTDIIESRIGPVVPRTVVEQLRGRDTFVLGQTPVVSVDSISGVLVAAQTYATAGLSLDPLSGVVRRTDRGTFGDDLFTITYTAGRSTIVPPRIVQAAKVLLRHLWSTQRGGRPTTSASDADGYAQSFSLPNRVLELLAADMMPAGIA